MRMEFQRNSGFVEYFLFTSYASNVIVNFVYFVNLAIVFPAVLQSKALFIVSFHYIFFFGSECKVVRQNNFLCV